MPKILSSKHYLTKYKRNGIHTAEFGFLGRNLAKGGGVRSGAAMGLKKLKQGKRFAQKTTKNLLKNKGTLGKISRYGYKKAQQGLRLGKRLGNSAIATGQSGINKIRRQNNNN